jgi:acetylornithine deacetylase/succinyl-diaminopimelate desuccinylase-like protein
VEDVKREILSITGEGVKLEPILTSQGTQFPTDSELYKLMVSATQEMDPEGIVMPFLMMGATDASAYQFAGIKMYGFTPGMLPPDISLVKMAHGHDERMPLKYIETGLPVLWKVVNGISR